MNWVSKRARWLAGLIVVSTALPMPASAVTFHWLGVSVNWTGETRYDEHGNPYFVPGWVESGYPQSAGDDAILQAGGTCNVNIHPTIHSLLLDDPGAILHSNGVNWILGAGMSLARGTASFMNSSVTTVTGLLNSATMVVAGATTVSGPFTSSGLVSVEGNSYLGNAALAVPTLANTGIVRLTSASGGYNAAFSGILNNLASGNLDVRFGTGGTRYFTGQLNNAGAIASEGVNFQIDGVWTNTGDATFNGSTWMTGAGNTLNMLSGTVNVPGGPLMLYGTVANLTTGTFSGPIALQSGTVNFANGSTIKGHLRTRADCRMTGKINPGMTVQIAGDSSVGNSSLTAPGASNSGELVMESVNGGYSQWLIGDFVNDPIGRISLRKGSGGIQYLNSNLANQGVLQVQETAGQLRGSLTNTGTVAVSAGGSMDFYDGSTLNQNAGTLDGGGWFWMHDGSTVNLNGGSVLGNVGTRGSSISIHPSVTGALRAFYSNNVVGAIGQGFELRAQGSSWVGDAVLNCTNVVNNGKMTLETDTGGYRSSIVGNVTNSATGVIATKVGAGGYRSLTGTFVNQGTMRVDGSPCEFRGTLTNTGTFQVLNGGWVHALDNSTVNMNGGSLGADAEFWMYGGTLNLNGGALSGRLGIHSGTVAVNPSVSGRLEAYGGNTVSGTLGKQMVLQGSGSSWQGNGMIVASPITNHGRLVLETATGGYNSDLQGTLTNASDGSFELLKGQAGNRCLSGTIVNQGALLVNDVHSEMRGTLTNSGDIKMTGGNMALYDNSTFNMDAGSLKTDGYFWAYGGTFNLLKGTLEGTVGILNGAITFKPGSSIQGKLYAQAGVAVNGTINTGASLTGQGNSSYGHATIASNDAKNAGELILETTNGGYDSNLSGAFQNLPSGLFQMRKGGGGRRYLDADIVNDGSMIVDAEIAAYEQRALVNNATLSVAGGLAIQGSGSFRLNKGSVAAPGWIWGYGRPFTLLGGTMTGTVGMDHGSIDFGADSKTTGTVTGRGDVALTGKNAAGMTVRCEGASHIGHSRLDCTGLQNRGSLILETLNGGYNSDLSGTLNNLPSGRILTKPGGGGWRTLGWTMDNLGLVEIATGTSLTNSGANHINGGTLRLKDGASLHLGGSTLTNDANALLEGNGTLVMNGLPLLNDGTINPGLSEQSLPIGSLAVNGYLVAAPAGTLAFEVGGTAVGQFDTLSVSGNLALDGELSVRAGGYVPRAGDRFKVLAWSGTRTGAFSRLPNPEYWQIVYNAKDVEAVRLKRLMGDVDGDDAVTIFDYNLLSNAFDSVEGDPNWDPRCDFDEDGAVTIYDYNILSDNFDVSV